jgi:enamine deaminase RidA (YjgF/YER057c/UK114 family)
MEYYKTAQSDLHTEIQYSVFKTPSSISEYHVIINSCMPGLSADQQFKNMHKTINRLFGDELLPRTKIVFERWFLSDVANQQPYLEETTKHNNLSVIQQSPLNETKVSVWLYLVDEDAEIERKPSETIFSHNHYKHLYHAGLKTPLINEGSETNTLFHQFDEHLKQHACSIAQNCIRTWIYVQGVDLHYNGMVKERQQYFNRIGLTDTTHYLASTGIEGRTYDHNCLIAMDGYSVKGLVPEQITYLLGATHLNPTHEYGVTFERGTTVQYGDRRHAFISGTASIDNKGIILFNGRIISQTKRALENIGVLLNEAGMDFKKDVAHLIVYLRDIADYQIVRDYLSDFASEVPTVIVHAPVCRPGWLIEMECIALKNTVDKRFAEF